MNSNTVRFVFTILISAAVYSLNTTCAHATVLTLPITDDTYVQTSEPDMPGTTEPICLVGYYQPECPDFSPWDCGPHICPSSYRTRTYLHVPIQELTYHGIYHGDIESVSLHLHQFDMRSWIFYPVEVHTLGRQWESGTLTWNSQPFIGPVVATVTISPLIPVQSIDLTTWVLDVLSGSAENNGLMLRASQENGTSSTFYSSDCSSVSLPVPCEESFKPHLSVIYDGNTPPDPAHLVTPHENMGFASRTVEFTWKPAEDADDDTVMYRLEIFSPSDPDTAVYVSEYLPETIHAHTFSHDGIYTWQVRANDQHPSGAGVSVSDRRTVTIDTTPPDIPVLESEPQYTVGEENTVYFGSGTEGSNDEYLFQASVCKDFSGEVKTSAWTREQSFLFDDLADNVRYYYRAQARDIHGNISEYSSVEASIQDVFLKIEGLNASMSPKNDNSDITRHVSISASITGGIQPCWDIHMTNSDISSPQEPSVSLAHGCGSVIDMRIPIDTNAFSQSDTIFITLHATDISGISAQTSPEKIAIVPTNTHESGKDREHEDSHNPDTGHHDTTTEPQSPTGRALSGNASSAQPVHSPTHTRSSKETPSNKPTPWSDAPVFKCSLIRNISTLSVQTQSCTPPKPRISSIAHNGTDGNGISRISITSFPAYPVTVQITYVRCKPKSFWDPGTWFSCKQEIIGHTARTVIPAIEFTYHTTPPITLSEYRTSNPYNNRFQLNLYSFSDPAGIQIKLRSAYRISLQFGTRWSDIYTESPWSDKKTVPKNAHPVPPPHPLSPVVELPVGVTQWHGYTAFQQPHTGIDFGVTTRVITSPADGTIERVGWDSSSGQCLSGGNFIKIRHDNGLYSVFFHLRDTKSPDGQLWEIGNRVQKGTPLGISGNTGSWNCQPLGHHLHYEIRRNSSQSTHTDPVPLTAVDWNSIPTLNWQAYPGRLTGDNPHPSF
ncbi:MAG: peptidoglycan DD-metalloendopeptidase family protein [Candidatus Dojkabacteria bacterium]|nr:peptidoglycan DD-metalloendopeptidase family protein [Candidatus Dojkabacteria bacterium]